MHKFTYPPLPENGDFYIRLIRLHPGTFDDDLHITMRHELFDQKARSSSNGTAPQLVDQPVYEAISYAWDKDLRPDRITVTHVNANETMNQGSQIFQSDTGKHVGWLPLGINAITALRHFRFPDRPRDLWIDYLCIDQGDKIDKGQQVSMMGQIYARAAAVLIWLGEGADDSGLAMDCMAEIGAQVRFDRSNRSITAAADCRSESLLDRSIPLPFSNDEMRAIYHLFNRKWFERLWVRQEITLADQDAATIACGSKQIPWKTFYSAWGLLHRKAWPQHFELGEELAERLANLRGFLYQSRRINLPNIRFNMGLAKCQDPRDRIYSVRALLPSKVQKHINPDYTFSTSEIYRAATIAYMQEMQDVDFLSQCRFSSLLPSCPTWVPDWSDCRHITEEPWPLKWQIASGFLSTQYMKPTSGRLKIHGVFVARVAAVTKLDMVGKSFAMNWASIGKVLGKEARGFDDPYRKSPMTIGEAYTRTLCSNRFAENNFGPLPIHRLRYDDAERRLRELYRATRDKNQEFREMLQYDRAKDAILLNRITSECLGRQLIWTEDGFLGLGPLVAQPGDQIWAVLGSRELLVLRPSVSQKDSPSFQQVTPDYEVGGGCSLCGYFEVEALLGLKPSNIQTLKHRAGAMFFENKKSGERTLLDPRLSNLQVDLSEFRAKLEKQQQENALDEPHPWVYVDDIEILRARLACLEVKLQDVHLV